MLENHTATIWLVDVHRAEGRGGKIACQEVDGAFRS